MGNWNEVNDLPSLETDVEVPVNDPAPVEEELPAVEEVSIETEIAEEPKEEPAPVVEEVKPEPVHAPISSGDDVVIYSLKDISGKGLKAISKGYSKVTEAEAEELLKNRNVRRARPEEITEYFNK